MYCSMSYNALGSCHSSGALHFWNVNGREYARPERATPAPTTRLLTNGPIPLAGGVLPLPTP